MAAHTSLRKVRNAILKSKRCIVVSHYNPDPDAYGASCALTLALRALGKEVECVNQNGRSSRYSFIPGMSLVKDSFPAGDWDTLVLCDCAGLDRVGERLFPAIPKTRVVINIDHHISNSMFGTHPFVLPEASSSSELVYNILEKIPNAISKDVAECLMTGIYGDTGSFRYSCTRAETFQTMFKLCKLGGSCYRVSSGLYGMVGRSELQLQTQALSKMEFHCAGKVAVVIVTRAMIESCGAEVEDAEPLSERARDIAGVEVAISIREDGEIWRVSLRSKNSKCNVSDLAMQFDGGGHINAAAFRWRRSLGELKEKLLPAVSVLIENAFAEKESYR